MTHVWNQYTIRVGQGQRDSLRSHLQAAGIGRRSTIRSRLHQQSCFQSLGYRTGSLPETERAASEVLSLPVFPQMTEQEQDTVVEQICRFYRRSSVVPPLTTPHLSSRDLTTS